MPEGVTITPLNPRGPALRITIAPAGPAPAKREDVDRVWAALREENPRLFDGPLLSVVSVDAENNHIACRLDSFKRLAVQRAEPVAASVRTGVHQLSVTGAVIGRDRAGRPHVLIGRRGAETRLYGGMWELAPAGGIDPPAGAGTGDVTLGMADVMRMLAKEAEEELGLELGGTEGVGGVGGVVPVVCRDEHASSDDLVVVVRLGGTIDPRRPVACAAGHDWEYIDTAWLAVDDAAGFVGEHAGAVIPPTRALLASTGWLDAATP